MEETARQYHPRAYRYTLRPDENCLIRYAGPLHAPWEEGTEIINISSSGLAFTTPGDLCPMVGELIKIEFEVPSESQIACYAKVVRISPASKDTQMVGVRFANLTPAHRILLKRGLIFRIQEKRQQKLRRALRSLPRLIVARWKPLLTWLVMFVVLAVWLYFMNTITWSF